MKKNIDYSLYLIIDPHNLKTGLSFEYVIREAIFGGVTVVQLRQKCVSTQQLVTIGKLLKNILDEFHIPLIVNDNIEAALAIHADGVHVGQCDTHYKEVRKRVGKNVIVGLSINNLEQMKEVNEGMIDYYGVGPVYPTLSKLDATPSIGIEQFKEIRKLTKKPIVAIGGISDANIGAVIKAGADGIAVISAICDAPQPKAAARVLKSALIKE